MQNSHIAVDWQFEFATVTLILTCLNRAEIPVSPGAEGDGTFSGKVRGDAVQ